MFNHFFETETNSGQKIKLLGEKQQQHTALLSSNQTIEYFKLDEIVLPCHAKINNLKACDYVLVDHQNKKILLCELKNSYKANVIKEAKGQLRHSKHIINLFLNILGENGYLFSLLALTTRKMNKQKIRIKQDQLSRYIETNKKEFKFNGLHYE